MAEYGLLAAETSFPGRFGTRLSHQPRASSIMLSELILTNIGLVDHPTFSKGRLSCNATKAREDCPTWCGDLQPFAPRWQWRRQAAPRPPQPRRCCTPLRAATGLIPRPA